RMGQTFTSTVGTIEVKPDQVRDIDDIERNGRVFSDGCGKISHSLAEKAIKRYWGKRDIIDKEIPSVYQIRFRGCKGVVAIDKELEGDVLCIRPSQRKFESYELYTLEIAKTVKAPQQGHLNRQIILLLSNLKIPDSAFLELQNNHQSFIESMMQDSKRAAEVIRQISRDGSHQTRTILEMLKAGLMDEEEPFLEAMLEVKKLFTLKDLRNKARIEVPSTFLLMGVMDETGILEPDQIYVQTSTITSEHQSFKGEKKVRREHRVWTGRSIVTRNPCLHPGDISVLWAVDVPELSHLRNCIVFSQNGDSPVVNSMAGGDLDGDEFFVSFDGRLIPTETYESLDYDAPPRKELDRPVTVYDIAEFFRDFMENDRLGTICNNHLMLADQKDLGVFSPECIDLAIKASMAVDFNKTGVPVTGRLPTSQKSPDFMENQTKIKYESQKILGKLYRNIDLNEHRDNEKRYYRKFPIEPFDRFVEDGYIEYINDALAQRDSYNQEVRNLMQRHKIKSEPEVFTGSLLSVKTCGRHLYD
ncbi:8362_t:CDS:2, partial [Paraglomus brasilianum]